jgi:hypothetical protein
MYVWSRLYNFAQDDTTVSLANRALSAEQRSIYFKGRCRKGTEEVYELVRRVYKGLRWQVPDEEMEELLEEAVKAVMRGDAMALREIRGEVEGLLPY